MRTFLVRASLCALCVGAGSAVHADDFTGVDHDPHYAIVCSDPAVADALKFMFLKQQWIVSAIIARRLEDGKWRARKNGLGDCILHPLEDAIPGEFVGKRIYPLRPAPKGLFERPESTPLHDKRPDAEPPQVDTDKKGMG